MSFWDTDHGLLPGSQATVALEANDVSTIAQNFEGIVTKNEGQKVWIEGHHWFG